MNLIHKEFLIAVANGEEVECKHDDSSVWNKVWKGITLAAFNDDLLEFRIKPKTLTLSMEIPMPFVPEVGDAFWYFEPSHISGVNQSKRDIENPILNRMIASGVYRTEEEAIQALAAHEAAIAKLMKVAK